MLWGNNFERVSTNRKGWVTISCSKLCWKTVLQSPENINYLHIEKFLANQGITSRLPVIGPHIRRTRLCILPIDGCTYLKPFDFHFEWFVYSLVSHLQYVKAIVPQTSHKAYQSFSHALFYSSRLTLFRRCRSSKKIPTDPSQ